MNKERANSLNPGFLISGLFGAYWVYKEITNHGGADRIFYLKNMVKHPTALSKENEGELVYVTGSLKSSDVSLIQDGLFNISVPGMKLRRKVEMFQWHKEPDSYALKWNDKPVNSKGFLSGYENPKWKIFSFEANSKGDLLLGDYKISPKVLDNVRAWREVIGNYKGNDLKQVEKNGKLILHQSKKKFVLPKIGNYRISHEYVPNGIFASAIGLQKGGKLVPHKGLFIFKEGLHSSNQLIDEFGKSENQNIWMTRVICSLGITAGLYVGFR
jgi:hypothetical protein